MCQLSNNIVKEANFLNDGVIEMKCGSLDGAEDGEHSGIYFVGISKIFAVQDAFFFKLEPFDRTQCVIHPDMSKNKH